MSFNFDAQGVSASSTIEISADRIDVALIDLANSTQAVGEAYARRYELGVLPRNTECYDPVLESKDVTTAYSYQGWATPPRADERQRRALQL